MNILAFDTSTHAFAAAVEAGKHREETRAAGLLKHSEMIFSEIERLMKCSKLSFKSLGAVAVGTGPGSFTGIRVGVTAAKTIAYALKIRLIGIDALECVAQNASCTERPVCVVQDARRSRVYTATFFQGQVVRPPALEHMGDFLFRMEPETLYTGDAMESFGEAVMRKFGRRSLVRDRRKWYPRSQALLEIAHRRIRQKCFDDPLGLEPLYLYDKTCNVTKPIKNKGR